MTFRGIHNLPLRRGHDDKVSSTYEGVFLGVVESCDDLVDVSLRSDFENSKVFKRTSKITQNDLLDQVYTLSRRKTDFT